jgi:catechol 2,3-dioxygenase-like lactoylglutathione lyase family enzyme
MELDAFSISLAVKDIQASKRFYEKYRLILKNGDHAIGLFQGMFEKAACLLHRRARQDA